MTRVVFIRSSRIFLQGDFVVRASIRRNFIRTRFQVAYFKSFIIKMSLLIQFCRFCWNGAYLELQSVSLNLLARYTSMLVRTVTNNVYFGNSKSLYPEIPSFDTYSPSFRSSKMTPVMPWRSRVFLKHVEKLREYEKSRLNATGNEFSCHWVKISVNNTCVHQKHKFEQFFMNYSTKEVVKQVRVNKMTTRHQKCLD